MVAFIVLGTALVLLQLAGSFVLDADLITGAVSWVGEPAYVVAAVAGLLAFGLEHAPKRSTTEF